MKPEEINRRCAKFMGWKLDHETEHFAVFVGNPNLPYTIVVTDNDYIKFGNFNPCENISDAMLLLDRAVKIKGVEISIQINNDQDNLINIDIYSEETGVKGIANCMEFKLNEFPMAICKAVLKLEGNNG